MQTKKSEHTLKNAGPSRFLVIEQDQGTIDEQAAILLHLAERAPMALTVHSGSRSLHGWFYCQGQPEERLRAFLRYAVTLGQIGRRGRAASLCGCQTEHETTATDRRSTSSTPGSPNEPPEGWPDIVETLLIDAEGSGVELELAKTLEDIRGFLCRYVMFSS
jgi:hypothetical protein